MISWNVGLISQLSKCPNKSSALDALRALNFSGNAAVRGYLSLPKLTNVCLRLENLSSLIYPRSVTLFLVVVHRYVSC